MNQYFLMDISLKKAYAMRKSSLRKLLAILYPQNANPFENDPIDCDKINNDIDKYLKDKLGGSTAGLCLDRFVELFGDGMIDTDKITIKETIHEIVGNKEIIRNNIEKRC